MKTIKELCQGRARPLPRRGEAPRDKRVAIMIDNIKIMREEIGYVPSFYPQSASAVPAWIDHHDDKLARMTTLIQRLA